jgi:hypothetical protein
MEFLTNMSPVSNEILINNHQSSDTETDREELLHRIFVEGTMKINYIVLF